MTSQDKKLEVDFELLDRIYAVCLTLISSKDQEEGAYVSWPFPRTQSNYDIFITPWFDEGIPLSFVSRTIH
jgi:hypothetical protein